MKNKHNIVLLSLLFSTVFLSISGCGEKKPKPKEDPEKPKEKEVFEVKNVDVNELKYAPIKEHLDSFVYSYNDKNIEINDGIVHGLIGGTVTEVSVTNGDLSTKFYVTVHNALQGTNNNPSAFYLEGNQYIKNSPTYGESICTLNGKALDQDGFIASGTFTFASYTDGAVCNIFVRNDKEDIKLALTPSKSGYYAKGIDDGKETDLGSFPQQRINFLVFASEGGVYYYLNDQLVWHTLYENQVCLGFSGEKSIIYLSRLSFAYNNKLVNELKSKAQHPFGANFFGVRPNDQGTFFKTGEGVYEKVSDGYYQQWLYKDANPVCAENYSVTGNVSMTRPASTGTREIETVFQACNKDAKISRILLRYDISSQKYYLFSDYETPNGFYGSTYVLNDAPNSFKFKFIYSQGVTRFFINGMEVFSSNSAAIGGVGYLGATHFGLAGQRCHITVSDISVEVV